MWPLVLVAIAATPPAPSADVEDPWRSKGTFGNDTWLPHDVALERILAAADEALEADGSDAELEDVFDAWDAALEGAAPGAWVRWDTRMHWESTDEAPPLSDPEPAEGPPAAMPMRPLPPPSPPAPPVSAAMRLIAASHLAQLRPRVQKETGFLVNRPYNICWPDGLLKHVPVDLLVQPPSKEASITMTVLPSMVAVSGRPSVPLLCAATVSAISRFTFSSHNCQLHFI